MKKEERLKEWNDYIEVASLGSLNRTARTQEKFKRDVLEEMKKKSPTAKTLIFMKQWQT
jgi:hypothetical protein